MNYLAIRNIYGQYYLNGQRNVAWPGVYKFGGTEFVYKRPYDDVETLTSAGPLEEDLVLEVREQIKAMVETSLHDCGMQIYMWEHFFIVTEIFFKKHINLISKILN